MKLIKYVLIGMAILGIIASTYNMIVDKSLSDVKTVIIGLITIVVALNIEKILDSLKSKESR
ncbi:MAG: hypothetical protein ABFR05_12370 [Bacteroidota bacterium]